MKNRTIFVILGFVILMAILVMALMSMSAEDIKTIRVYVFYAAAIGIGVSACLAAYKLWSNSNTNKPKGKNLFVV